MKGKCSYLNFYLTLILGVWLSGWVLAQGMVLIEEPAGVGRIQEPLSVGITFPKGTLQSGDPVRLLDENNLPVDAQFMNMGFWPDGSVRWRKADFQVSLPAGAQRRIAVEAGTGHPVTSGLTVADNAGLITVNTGPLRFTVSKNAFSLIEEAWLDRNRDGIFSADERVIRPGGAAMVQQGGTVYSSASGAPISVAVEENGPMKVVIRISGFHHNGNNRYLKYQTRIYAYNGSATLRIRHSFANGTSVSQLGSSGDPAFGAALDRYQLKFPLDVNPGGNYMISKGEDAVRSGTLSSGSTLRLVQHTRNQLSVPLSFDLFENGAVLESGATTNGFASLSDTRHGILLAARYFWEKNPRGISLSEDGTLIYEAAAEPDFLYAGMGSGDELLLHFHPNSSVSELQSLAEGEGRQPLQGLMRSGDYAAARPFYALSDGFSARWPGFAAYLTQTTANHFAARENLGLYGSTNFGDMIAIDGGANAMDINASGWGNNYYDGLLLTPARLLTMGAERRYLDILIPGARHWMESDAWQSDDPDDWMNGYCPAYSLHHRDVGHFQHHYGEGVWAYYYLSGDERAREVGLNAANSIIRQQAWGNENTGCRQAYQRASACLEAYKATTDPAYLAHARLLIAGRILATQDHFGLLGGYFTEGGFHITQEQTFMMALFSDVLWKFIRELPDNDPDRQGYIDQLALLADCIDTYARKQPGVEEYWNFWQNPPSDTNPPQPVTSGNGDETVYWNGKALIAGTYAYAYDLTGNTRYLDLARNLLDHLWSSPDAFGQEFFGKASSQALKNVLHAMAIVDDALTGIKRDSGTEPVAGFQLRPNYPNPFNPETRITFQLRTAGPVELAVFNLAGEKVATLIRETLPAGQHQVSWMPGDMASGVYFYRLSLGAKSETRKMVLLR